MPPQFFVKFQYSDRIKKIGLTEDEFTWANMAKVLSQSFSIPKDRLKLTYKDPEGDEITACCDEDLIEAYKACSDLQPMRFFVYLCNNVSSAKLESKNTLSNSKSQRELENSERNSEELKIKSEEAILDQICEPEKEKSLSEGALQASIENPELEKQVEVGTEEIGRILEEILLTRRAKEKILEMRKVANNEGKSGSKYVIAGDQKMLADCVTNIFNKVLNETIEIDGEEEKVHSINSIVESDGDHVQRTSMLKDWKSMDEEKREKNIKPSSENNLLNASLKESIYEKSTFSPPEETKQGDLQDTFAGRSMSFCRDLSTTYGVKLALRFENGKAKLLSVPTQEYSIIENSQQNDKSESLKRSASMAECPKEKKSAPQDYSEYFRLSLVD